MWLTYATQEILVVLAAAGMGALHFVFPVSVAIVALLAIVTLSYEQTIHITSVPYQMAPDLADVASAPGGSE